MSAGKLGALLVSKGLITNEQLSSAVALQAQEKTRLGSSLVKLGHVNENVLVSFLSTQYGIAAVSLEGTKVPKEVSRLVPKALCLKHMMVPISVENNRITLALSDPTNVSAIDDVRFMSNLEVSVVLATESGIQNAIDIAYQESENGLSDLEEFARDKTQTGIVANGQESIDDNDKADSKPVIKLINKIFLEAIRRKVSDIHIEPYETLMRVRFRIDGSLHEVMKLPNTFRTPVPARIKVMSNLDIAEKRLPQDGRIQIRTKEKAVDIRVSLVPTLYGEKIVMRILDRGGTTPDIEKMGMEPQQLEVFKKAAEQPYGMILVTGPTGSGKTTTLYSALSGLNTIDVNISTAEDPVEYTLLGINQVHVKESIGMSFAGALRSFLRQDPDIIMVGEIRDHETAEISVKAALTGHMVFSTLHTNDAPSTISRLRHMGLEPFLITAAVTCIEAQRLVRMLCPNCKEEDTSFDKKLLVEAEMPEDWLDTATIMKPKGCDKCAKTGYKGRKGIFEVMAMNEEIRDRVIRGASSDDLKKVAMASGMLTLRQSGLLKLSRGETTLQEVLNNSRPDGDLTKK